MKNQNVIINKKKTIIKNYFLVIYCYDNNCYNDTINYCKYNNWSSTIDINNSSNWSSNQDKIWEEYYKNNCPPNKKYKLTDYEGNLKNITLKSTNKKLKNFYLSDLLKNYWCITKEWY